MPLKRTELRETGWLIAAHANNKVNWQLLPISTALRPAAQGGHGDRDAVKLWCREPMPSLAPRPVAAALGTTAAFWDLRSSSDLIQTQASLSGPGDRQETTIAYSWEDQGHKASSSQTEGSRTIVCGDNFISLTADSPPVCSMGVWDLHCNEASGLWRQQKTHIAVFSMATNLPASGIQFYI